MKLFKPFLFNLLPYLDKQSIYYLSITNKYYSKVVINILLLHVEKNIIKFSTKTVCNSIRLFKLKGICNKQHSNIAAENGNYKIVKNIYDNIGILPNFKIACCSGNTNLIKYLCMRGGKIKREEFAKICIRGNIESLYWYLPFGWKKFIFKGLCKAYKYNNIKTIKYLHSYNIKFSHDQKRIINYQMGFRGQKMERKYYKSHHYLVGACAGGKLEIVKRLINIKNNMSIYIESAVDNKQYDIFKYLLLFNKGDLSDTFISFYDLKDYTAVEYLIGSEINWNRVLENACHKDDCNMALIALNNGAKNIRCIVKEISKKMHVLIEKYKIMNYCNGCCLCKD